MNALSPLAHGLDLTDPELVVAVTPQLGWALLFIKEDSQDARELLTIEVVYPKFLHVFADLLVVPFPAHHDLLAPRIDPIETDFEWSTALHNAYTHQLDDIIRMQLQFIEGLPEGQWDIGRRPPELLKC